MNVIVRENPKGFRAKCFYFIIHILRVLWVSCKIFSCIRCITIISFADSRLERKILRTSAVPSQFNWTKAISEAAINRDDRAKNREQTARLKELPGTFGPSDFPIGSEVECDGDTASCSVVEPTKDICTQTHTPTTTDTSSQTSGDRLFSLEKYATDDDAIHFYTGLENYMKVCFVLSTLGAAQDHLIYMYGGVKGISVKDQFFLVLMKLRRYYTNFELSRMFQKEGTEM